MEKNESQYSLKGCALSLLLLVVASIGVYMFMDSGPDCVRIIPDGTVRCECDYKSSDDWQKFKEDTHGTWEAVVFKDDYDPCKK